MPVTRTRRFFRSLPVALAIVFVAACGEGVVDPANQPPTAAAGSDQTDVPVGSVVALAGSGTDPEGAAVSYSWSLTDGAGADRSSLLSDGSGASSTFTPDETGTWTALLTVSDGSLQATDDVTIDVVDVGPVLPNDGAPVLTQALPDSSVLVMLTAEDPAGNPLTFEIVTGPENGTLGSIESVAPQLARATDGPFPNSLTTNAAVRYTPNSGFSGADRFTYRASNDNVSTPIGEVTLAVTSIQPQDVEGTIRGGTVGGFHLALIGVEGLDDGIELKSDLLPASLRLTADHGLQFGGGRFEVPAQIIAEAGSSGEVTGTYWVEGPFGRTNAANIRLSVEEIEEIVVLFFKNLNAVGLFDVDEWGLRAIANVSGPPEHAAWGPDGNDLFVSIENSSTVDVLRLEDFRVYDQIALPVGSRLGTVNFETNYIYSGNAAGSTIDVTDPTTGGDVRSISLPVGTEPGAMLFTAFTHQLHVVDENSGQIILLDVFNDYRTSMGLPFNAARPDVVDSYGDTPRNALNYFAQASTGSRPNLFVNSTGVGTSGCTFEQWVLQIDDSMRRQNTVNFFCFPKASMNPLGTVGVGFGSILGRWFTFDTDGFGNLRVGSDITPPVGRLYTDAIALPSGRIVGVDISPANAYHGLVEYDKDGNLVDTYNLNEGVAAGDYDASGVDDVAAFRDGFSEPVFIVLLNSLGGS
ncbi:MAG: Ig-like domain-containing protein [Gemmatimonadota bacterium]